MSVAAQTEFQLPNSTEPTPPTLTGIGMVAGMLVSGNAGPYNNAQITESVSPVSTTCQQQQWETSACQGSSTFTVGTPASWFGTNFPANANEFYDTHVLLSTTNALGGTGNCTITCGQTYSCGGNAIGNFTINFNLANGTVGSHSVTQVTASKN